MDDYDWNHYEWAASVEKTRDMQPRDFEEYKDAATVIMHQRALIESLERENARLRGHMEEINKIVDECEYDKKTRHTVDRLRHIAKEALA